MALTPKQEAFAQAMATGFYVYELIDPRDTSVFYIGKGVGKRISQHVRNAKAGRVDNAEKHKRIVSIHDAGLKVIERVISTHESEARAFIAEREAIAKSKYSLTNIVGGVVTNAELVPQQAKAALKNTKSFDEWVSTITAKQFEAVGGTIESMKAFYENRINFLTRMAKVTI